MSTLWTHQCLWSFKWPLLCEPVDLFILTTWDCKQNFELYLRVLSNATACLTTTKICTFNQSTNQLVHKTHLQFGIHNGRHCSFHVLICLHSAFKEIITTIKINLNQPTPWRTVHVDWLICGVIEFGPFHLLQIKRHNRVQL